MPISNRRSRCALLASSLLLLACLCLPATGHAAGTWSIQNPTTATLTGISCADASTCWSVGAKGTVVGTSDAGATWASQPSGVTNNLNGVSCPTTLRCVAVGNKAGAGSNGAVITTADGGDSWTARSSGTANDLAAVSCADADTCWAVGQNGTILKSTNAGASWASQVSGTTSRLKGVSCPSASTCFAVGEKSGPGTSPAILTTTNGGSTWTAQTPGTQNNLRGVACSTTSVCRAVGQGGTIVLTVNGGANWSVQTSNTAQELLGIACASVVKCRAVGNGGTIVATDDGTTWAPQASGRTVALNAVTCADANVCRVAGATGSISGTSNGGSTWQAETSGVNAMLRGVSCVSTSSCWAVGDQGAILTTTTGGASWLRQTSGITKALNDVACVGFGTCYAVGQDNGPGTNALILKTVNGGGSWTVQNSGVTGQLFGVACTTATTCWAVGQNGAVVATTNGTSWAPQSSGVTKQLNDVACPSSTVCFAAGATNGAGTNGLIVKTSNGGTSWAQQNSNLNVNLNGIACTTTSDCVVVGQNGKVATTASGGTAWTAATSGTTANLQSVACGSATACWAVGGNSGPGTQAVILKSVDTGTTWTPQTSNTTSNLEAVAFSGASYGWAVGAAGTVDAYVDDSTPPDPPDIDSAPFSPSADTNPSWSFSGEDSATFECRLDRGGTPIENWTPCSGSAAYDLAGEPDGTYRFSVRSTDSAGNTGAAAVSDYTLDTAAPGLPVIDSRPADPTSTRNPAWAFSGEAGASFECRLDQGGTQVLGWAPCTGTKSYTLMAQPDAVYTFSVRATDAAGNVGLPATDSFTLDTSSPAAPLVTGAPASPDNSPSPLWSFTSEASSSPECRLDRGATQVFDWAPCGPTAFYDLSAKPDGAYTFAVRTTDAAGNTSSVATSSYTLDRAAPAAPTIVSEPASPGPDLSPAWSFTGEQDADFECALEPSGGGAPSYSSCTSPSTMDLSGQPDGTYTFYVRAVDAAGNPGPAETSDYVLDAAAPPAPNLDSAPPAADDDTHPAWSFSAPGATGYECRLTPGSDPSWDWSPCTSGHSYDLSTAGDGAYTFSVRAVDGASNTSAATSRTYTLDTAVPDAPDFVDEPPSPGSDRGPSWTFTGEDDATFECELRRGLAVVSAWGCDTTTEADLSSEGDGLLTLSVRARDAAGNLGPAATSDYELDTSAPITAIDTSPATPSKSRTPSWSFAAELGADYTCRLVRGGTEIEPWGTCSSPRAFDLAGMPDGQYTFFVRASDGADNLGPVASGDYVLDTASPAAPQVTSAPASPGRSTSPSWSFTGEAGAALKCRLDQGATTVSNWTTCAGQASYDLSGRPDAQYTFSVRATDTAGNDSLVTTRQYTVDTTPPAMPGLTGSPGPIGAGTSPAWSFSGELGATFECRLDRGGTPFEDWAPCSGSTGYDLTGEADSTFTFAVRAIDSVGNVGPSRTDVYELLTAAPPAPVWVAEPVAVGNSRAPAWQWTVAGGTTAECRVARGSTEVAAWAACSSPFVLSLAGQLDGAYELSVRAVNAAGTRGPAAQSGYTLDTQAPAAPDVAPLPKSVGSSPTPSWSFTGEAGAELQCRVERGSELVTDWETCASPYGVGLAGKPDGTYTVSVRARDAAGNIGESAGRSYRLLTTVPGTPRFQSAPGPIGRARSVSWSFAGDPGEELECRLDLGAHPQADWQPCPSPRAFDLSAGGDGAYEFSVRARNEAGTVGPVASSAYLLDTAPPDRPELRSTPRAVGHDTTPTWGFAGELGASIECRLRGPDTAPAWAHCTSPRSFGLKGKDDGRYVFEARATDAAGNVGSSVADPYVFDTTAPGAPKLTATPGEEGTDRTPSWSFSGERDATFECQLRRPGDAHADWDECTSPSRYDLDSDATGAYTFAVRATDEAENTGDTATSGYRLTSPAAAGSASEPSPSGSGPPAATAPPSSPATPAPASQPASSARGPSGDEASASESSGAPGRGRDGRGGAAVGSGSRKRPGAARGSNAGGSPAPQKKEARGKLGKTLAFAREAVAKAATAIAENADKSVFPFSLIVIVALFLAIQGRIDRNDPKLAHAPLAADTEIGFGPPARLPRLHDGPVFADTGKRPGYGGTA